MDNSVLKRPLWLCANRVGRDIFTAILLSLHLCLSTQSTAAVFPGQNIYALSYFWAEDNGDSVQFSKWKGKPIILAMAYGDCIRVCSATLRKLEETQSLANTLKVNIDFVIVSIDPKQDTPQSWYYYRKKHGLVSRENWHFLTGTEASTRQLARLMDIHYWMDEDHVIHDFKILRLNPDGSIQSFLDWDHQEVSRLFEN
jgi:protein SCO1/2